MATKKDTTIYNRNPLIDGGSWEGTVANCRQVLKFLENVDFAGGGFTGRSMDEDENMGIYHIHRMLAEAMQYELEKSDRA